MNMKLEDYDNVRGVYLDVDLMAPPKERWGEAIDQVGNEICRLMKALEESIEECVPEFPPVWQKIWKIRRASASVLARTVSFISAGAGLEYAKEAKGIAKACDLPFGMVLIANLTYDLVQLRQNFAPTACSSFSCTVGDRAPVLVRNLDWGFPEGLGRYSAVIRFNKKRDSYLSIGIPGLTGVLSAMREGHWAVTLNQAPVAPRSIGIGQVMQIPVTQRIRAVCDGFGTYRTFLNRLEEYQTMTPFFAHVVGTRPEQQVVLQGFGREFSRRAATDGLLIQTNHYVEAEFAPLNGRETWTDHTGIEWTMDSRPRYKALTRRLKTPPDDLSSAFQKLKRSPVTHDNTIQSMAFCPATSEWRPRIPS